jgi:phage/plasmid primase-like uncharacterized protein
MSNDAREVAALVPMPRLLAALGFEPNERTRRGLCPFHGGKNPSAFSWTDSGLWHCYSCLQGGDRIALVRAARNCSFREALLFLAALVGVELEQEHFSRTESEGLRQERKAEERAAHVLADAEHNLLLALSKELESLRRIRVKASASLAAGQRAELCWAALSFVAETLPSTDAAYCICAFSAPVEQARFTLHPELRATMINSALERGFVVTSKGYRFEVALQ